ncbi:MAG: histidine kinase [Xenococcaceae cyanobacterium MO_188.B29]|nr:histidine kinase [Xenococcaceae cyanobacterium MO_188.B29]
MNETESKKDKIINNLQQAKQTGQLKAENIKDIVKTAITEAVSEIKEGRAEISNLVQDAIAAVVETFQDKKGEIKEEITASIEGAVEGISDVRRKAINNTQSEIKTLEAKVVTEEEQLQQEIDGVLEDLQAKSQENSTNVKEAIASAIHTIKNSEEVALLQKRYAQLKAQLAIVQANLAGRYGESSVNVSQYLDEAKTWYEKAKENPEVFTGKIEEKQLEFEQKLGEAGQAIAKKERQIKQLLKELWKSISEIFRDK